MSPIIQSLSAVRRKHLPSNLPKNIRALLECAQRICQSDYMALEKIFLCYYFLINNSIPVQWNKANMCEKYSKLFLGALMSADFIALSKARRYRLISTWNCAVKVFHANGIFQEPALNINCKLSTEDLRSIHSTFSRIKIGDTATSAIRTWLVESQSGQVRYLSLSAMHIAYGTEFTESVYNTCKLFISNSRSSALPVIGELSEFMMISRHSFTRIDFMSPTNSKKFWSEFKVWFFTTGHKRGVKLRVLADHWKTFCNFASKRLFGSGLFCTPLGGISKSCPTFLNLDEVNTRQVNGQTYNYKLTRPIPNELSDSEAIEIIFKSLTQDIGSIKRWALRHARVLKQRLRDIQDAGSTSTLETLDLSDLKPETDKFKQRAIAVHKMYGHVTDNDIRINTAFPRPLSESARVIAAPTAATLIPLVYYLIVLHPQLTPSFLYSLEIYDAEGNAVGLIKADHGTYLHGFKVRRGAIHAEQKIKLTKVSLSIIKLIIGITKSAREYLKKNGDPNWRRLLITTGKGFGYPRPIASLSFDRERAHVISSSLSNSNVHTTTNTEHLPLNLSAKSIRATSAVLEFIKHKNLSAIASALGHNQVCERLLRRYIPKSLMDFFNRRWIQIFNQALIIESMNGSELLLQATDFKTTEEIAVFLEAHYVKFASSENSQEPSRDKPPAKSSANEILIIINEQVLILMLRLSQDITSDQQSLGLTVFWRKMSKAVIEQVDSPDFLRQDIKSHLDRARAKIAEGKI